MANPRAFISFDFDDQSSIENGVFEFFDCPINKFFSLSL
jgi:hypothetical protein